jgi:hypothetical protein
MLTLQATQVDGAHWPVHGSLDINTRRSRQIRGRKDARLGIPACPPGLVEVRSRSRSRVVLIDGRRHRCLINARAATKARTMSAALTGICVTSQQALLLSRKERQDDRLFEPDTLFPDSPSDAQQVARARTIVISTGSPGLAERSSGIVMRRHDRHPRSVLNEGRVSADDVRSETGEERLEHTFRSGMLNDVPDPVGGLSSSAGEAVTGDEVAGLPGQVPDVPDELVVVETFGEDAVDLGGEFQVGSQIGEVVDEVFADRPGKGVGEARVVVVEVGQGDEAEVRRDEGVEDRHQAVTGREDDRVESFVQPFDLRGLDGKSTAKDVEDPLSCGLNET